MHVGFLLYPDLTQLDLTGPYEVLHRIPDAKTHLVWKTLEPVRADSGLSIVPTTTLEACPPLDILCVPGGAGQIPLMGDDAVLSFLRTHGARAKWVTSVCTGSLLLGAAGLLDGYAATTHWAFTELLAQFGAKLGAGRVVVDRNRITAGGVTAGIDLGLHLLVEIAGERAAKLVELGLEYDPEPRFGCGHPRDADPELVAASREMFASSIAARQR